MTPDPISEKRTDDIDSDKLLPLLEERSRLKKLLLLIQSKRNEVSGEVLARVKADYESRLLVIDNEISRQARNFESTLLDYREVIERLERALELGLSSLEELKVRYALGEYTREEFEEITREKKDKIDLYRGKIKTFKTNQDRLESVLAQLKNS
jgi:seryl-tRNA synthetase